MIVRYDKLLRKLSVFLTIAVAFATAVEAQSDGPDAHLAIDNPAELSKEEARAVYKSLQRRMARGYAGAQLEEIRNYQNWPLFSDAPYISATHGQRYVHSYANRMAHNYGTLQEGEVLPVGSVLAKDSITVTESGNTHPGALFVMEKLPQGTSSETADWRYIMVMPDGSLFGDTVGDRPDTVTYCHTCHEAVADRDYTFYVPEEYRLEN